MSTTDNLRTAAELAAYLRCSERTVARMVAEGMPSILVRGRRVYDRDECLRWMREKDDQCRSEKTPPGAGTQRLASAVAAYTDAYRRVQLRVMPSASRRS